MGEMNLLQSNFTGSVGAVTGVKWKKQNVIKKKIWHKAPPQAVQTNSLRAFEALNRVSAKIAKLMWYQLGISDRHMQKHNAIAKMCKAVVENHSFNVMGFSQIFPVTGETAIQNYSEDTETNTVT